MSDGWNKQGPVIPEAVEEVQGVFPNDAALQDALGRLRMMGFDHADLSLPATNPVPSQATSNQGAADPLTEDDQRQARTLGTSIAGVVGAFAAAGATVATGGVAGVAIAAAAVTGIGSALTVNAASTAVKKSEDTDRRDSAAAGQLVLAVHAPTAEKQADAERVMREAGATNVASVRRNAGAAKVISSAGWTG